MAHPAVILPGMPSPGDSLKLPFEERRILTVTGLNREARQLVEGLGSVWVEGEISNLARPSSGHLYWSLKDSQAQVRCAMFRMSTRGLGFELANGRQVLVRARASVYEARGEYQLIVDYVEEAGEGALRRKFEELKRKLAAEGLFDADRKRPLPLRPPVIALVTSPTGAVRHDVCTVLARRWPLARVLLVPCQVQGNAAPASIVAALRALEAYVADLAAAGREAEAPSVTPYPKPRGSGGHCQRNIEGEG